MFSDVSQKKVFNVTPSRSVPKWPECTYSLSVINFEGGSDPLPLPPVIKNDHLGNSLPPPSLITRYMNGP